MFSKSALGSAKRLSSATRNSATRRNLQGASAARPRLPISPCHREGDVAPTAHTLTRMRRSANKRIRGLACRRQQSQTALSDFHAMGFETDGAAAFSMTDSDEANVDFAIHVGPFPSRPQLSKHLLERGCAFRRKV